VCIQIWSWGINKPKYCGQHETVILEGLRFSQRCCRRFRSSWIWHCAAWQVVPNVLEDHSAFEMLGTTHPVSQLCIQEFLNGLWYS
jgi:hypothetical protein